MLLNYPLELVVVSYLTGQIFSRINDINHKYISVIFLFVLILITFFFIETSILLKDLVDKKYYPQMEREVRLGIVEIILKKMETNYDNIKSGDLISRLLKTPLFVSFFYERINRWVIPFLMTLGVIIVYLFFLNKQFGAIITGVILVYLSIIILFAYSDIKRSEKKEKEENRMMEDIEDTIINGVSILSSGKLESEKERINQNHDSYDKIYKDQLRGTALIKWGAALMNLLLIGTIIGLSLIFFKKGKMKSATTISIITMSLFLIKHLRFLTPRASEAFIWIGILKHNNEYIQHIKLETPKDGHLTNIPITGKIEFKNVFFTYPESNKVTLKNISFKINPGERVGIIGSSGSGKSSITKLLMGFYPQDKGSILLDGVDISKISKKYLRNNISIVTQNIKLFNRSIIENIAYGTKYSPEEIEKRLRTMDIMNVFYNLPNGLDSNVGKYGDKLSGGQKQIIYLLRCYFRSNPIVILDEPTSSIDVFHKKYVIKMIEEISKNSTLIVVTHDETITGLFNRRILINRGEILN